MTLVKYERDKKSCSKAWIESFMASIRCANCSKASTIATFAKEGWRDVRDWVNNRMLYFCCEQCAKNYKALKSVDVEALLLKTKRTN